MDKVTDKIARLEFELESLQDCQHLNTRIRVKTASNNMKMYCWQCLNCGRVLKTTDGKTWLPKESIVNLDRIEPFDEELSNTHREMISLLYNRLSENRWKAKQEDFWAEYPDYLQSEVWRKKRMLVLRRANHLCEGCGEQKATIIHHTTYAHKFHEFLFELVAVCEECHNNLHSDKVELNGKRTT